MNGAGIHHLGLATHNMEATLAFYEQTLGFTVRVCDMLRPEAGGKIRHAFIDVGGGEMLAFMECNGVPGISADFDTGLNEGLGIHGGVLHFAFKARDEMDLEARRDDLRSKQVSVSDVVDHGWCKSIYFSDPNQLQLEFCVVTTALGDSLVADRTSDDWQSLARD